jgi:hypothetical protein
MNFVSELIMAIPQDSIEDIVKLLKQSQISNEHKREVFKRSCIFGRLDIVKYLIKEVNPSHDDNISIKKSITNGHFHIVELLINNENVKFVDNYLNFIKSVINKDIKELKRLLKLPDFSPEIENNFALKQSIQNSFSEVTKLLFEDERVKESLLNNDFTFYNYLTKENIKTKINQF